MYTKVKYNNRKKIKGFIEENYTKDTIIVCIGTPYCDFDSIAPSIGSRLKVNGNIRVIGTKENPVDATNIEHIKGFIGNSNLLVIDAAETGKLFTRLGDLVVGKGELTPGSALNKGLGSLGGSYIKIVTTKKKWFIDKKITDRLQADVIQTLSSILTEVANEYRTQKRSCDGR